MASILVGCSASRKVKDGDLLLVRNKVESKEDLKPFDTGLNSIVKQKPNRRFLGVVKLRLQMWNLAEGKDDSRFWFWVRETLGEKPVLYDSIIARESSEQISKFLFKEGYFRNSVSFSTDTLKRKRLKVTYKIDPGKLFYVDTFLVDVQDTQLSYVVNPILKKYDVQDESYSYNKLEKLRVEITNSFKEEGFFEFNKTYVRFKVDTLFKKGSVKLSLQLVNPEEGRHQKFYVRNVKVSPEYNFFDKNASTETVKYKGLRIIYSGKRNITPRFLYQNIFLDDDEYAQSKYTLTYQRLTGVNVFSNVRINLNKVAVDSLDAEILLTPSPKHSFFVESRVESRVNTANSNRDINFGLSGNVSYAKRNAFKNGEFFLVSLSGGVEPFFLFDSLSANSNFFNTVQFGPSVSITYPRFLLPINQSKFSKLQFPETKLTLAYNRLENTSILRETYSASLAYQWKEGSFKTHNIAPIDISVVDAKLSANVRRRIEAFNNPFLLNSYTNQFILAHSYTFIFSKPINPKTRFSYRGKAELAGIIPRFITQSEVSNVLDNTVFAHYILNEHEVRLQLLSDNPHSWAFRFFGGLGVGLKANPVLPFDRRFFAGGSVGLRAWRATTIGPGAYRPPFNEAFGNLNRLGDVKLEANAEYRFSIVGPLSSAFFVDAGNIWERQPDPDKPNANFTKNFYKQIAVGIGTGLRFDFDFLVVRIDAALKFHDPSLPKGERFLFQDKDSFNQSVNNYNANRADGDVVAERYKNNLNFNFGIGYPF